MGPRALNSDGNRDGMGWYMEGRLLHTEFSEDLQYSQGNTMAPGTYPSTAPPRKWGGGWEGWETSLLDSRNGARNSCMGTYSLSIRSVPGGPRVTSIHSCSPMKWTIRFSHGADEEIWGSILNFPAYKVPAFSTKHTGWYQRVRTFFFKKYPRSKQATLLGCPWIFFTFWPSKKMRYGDRWWGGLSS